MKILDHHSKAETISKRNETDPDPKHWFRLIFYDLQYFRKKTRREIAREIFGDSQSSQEEEDSPAKEDRTEEKNEEKEMESDSVEIISLEKKKVLKMDIKLFIF